MLMLKFIYVCDPGDWVFLIRIAFICWLVCQGSHEGHHRFPVWHGEVMRQISSWRRILHYGAIAVNWMSNKTIKLREIWNAMKLAWRHSVGSMLGLRNISLLEIKSLTTLHLLTILGKSCCLACTLATSVHTIPVAHAKREDDIIPCQAQIDEHVGKFTTFLVWTLALWNFRVIKGDWAYVVVSLAIMQCLKEFDDVFHITFNNMVSTLLVMIKNKCYRFITLYRWRMQWFSDWTIQIMFVCYMLCQLYGINSLWFMKSLFQSISYINFYMPRHLESHLP